jgi:hypothetical protein
MLRTIFGNRSTSIRDFGMHRDFNARSRLTSLRFWATTHRETMAAAALSVAAMMLATSAYEHGRIRSRCVAQSRTSCKK